MDKSSTFSITNALEIALWLYVKSTICKMCALLALVTPREIDYMLYTLRSFIFSLACVEQGCVVRDMRTRERSE